MDDALLEIPGDHWHGRRRHGTWYVASGENHLIGSDGDKCPWCLADLTGVEGVIVITGVVVVLDGWAGRREYPVEIIDETPKRYRVRWLTDSPKAIKHAISLVPKYAVRRKEGSDK